MKKGMLSYLTVPLIIFLFLDVSSIAAQEKQNELAMLTKAAFESLDRQVEKGFNKGFQLHLEETNAVDPLAPLFENLGDHSYAITTESKAAQKYFDQGLRLTYAFNHAEAHRSFKEASRQDGNSAMTYWGQAYALGPNINDPFPDNERKKSAYHAIEQASQQLENASEKEKELILALSKRYGLNYDSSKPISYGYKDGDNADLEKLNKSYSAAMKKLAQKYPEDADILSLYAASVMNIMPWNYWDRDDNANSGITEAKQALELAIKLNPKHPGAHHYYIHLVEKPKPELAVPSAEVLGGLMPAAGHLVHMPSHIYLRVGRYKDAVLANIEAIRADEDYISQCYSQGMYPLGYYPHNIHFLWSASSLIGNSSTALAAANKTAQKVPIGSFDVLPFLQDFYSTPMLSYVRFGKWNEILTIPNPGNAKHVSVIWHYARGIAFIRKNNIKEAEEELLALKSYKDDASLENLMGSFTNSTSNIAKVAYYVVSGELNAASQKYELAIEDLRKAVEYEDALVYSEPAAWHIPVRQVLGAVLLKSGDPAGAEEAYREDLEKVPLNVWSLKGLHNSLVDQGKSKEADKVLKQFEKVRVDADIEINSSVI